jgi:hypothetical protein
MEHMEPGRCGGSFEGRGTKLYRVSGGSALKRWWPNDKFGDPGDPHGLDTSTCIWYVGQVFLKCQLGGVFWSFQIFQSQPFMVILCNIVYYWVYDMYGYMIICIYILYTHTTHSFLFDALMPGHVTIATERIWRQGLNHSPAMSGARRIQTWCGTKLKDFVRSFPMNVGLSWSVWKLEISMYVYHPVN